MLGVMKYWRGRLGVIPFSLLTASLLVLLCGYSIYSIWLSVKPFGGTTINVAGRQRMLSQQIAKETLLLIQEPSIERRIQSRQRIFSIVAQFRRAQEGLERGNRSLNLSGENTVATHKILTKMTPNMKLLTGNVEAIYGLRPRDLLRLTFASPNVQGILAAGELLMVNYDDFIREYIAAAEKEIVQHKVLEMAGFAAAFLLILYAQLVVRSLGRQIQRFADRLSGKHRMLKKEFLIRRRLEEEHRLLVAAVEQANESIVITDSSGNVRYVNPAYVRNTGYSSEEIVGKTQSVLRSGEQDSAFYQQLWNTISSGQAWRGQMINRRKDGSLHTEIEAIYPIRNRKGRILNYAGIKHDITREVQMEQQLRESQKLGAIGVLAGGIAHDFNNLLTPIIGFTVLTMDLVPGDSEARNNLEIVHTAANRAKDIVTQIRNAAREYKGPNEAIYIQTITREVLTLIRSTASKSIAITEEIPQDLAAIQGDASVVYRLLMNLCVNACEAMPEGGQLAIALGVVRLHETSKYLAEPAPGPFIRVEVKDTGHGMNEETKARIFEPYFTTRGGSSGTGLGLYLVFNLVKQLKGGIRVASRENVGTTFEIILPVPQSLTASDNETEGLEMPGHERILFIDDEASIAKLAKSVLENQGYRVTALSDSTAALSLFEEAPNLFDVVFTDRSMPGLSGEELAKRVKGIRPTIPIIMCSGFLDGHAEQGAKAIGVDAYIQKPFAQGVLSNTIRRVLGRGHLEL